MQWFQEVIIVLVKGCLSTLRDPNPDSNVSKVSLRLCVMHTSCRTLIQSWQGADKRLQMVVQDDEALVAEALIEFM